MDKDKGTKTEWSELEEGEMIGRFARELYAIRFSPIPKDAKGLDLYHSAMALRRDQFDTDESVSREVWYALAGDMLDSIFDGRDGDQPSRSDN